MNDQDKDTEELLADAEAGGYVDVPPAPIGPDDPDWVEPAKGVTPIWED